MNIFSKWFNPLGDLIKEREENMSKHIQVSSNNNGSNVPQSFPEAVRYVVEEWGVDYLRNRSFVNVLNDFNIFRNLPAAKHILQNMQANGYIEKIIAISNWDLDSKSTIIKYVNEFGVKEDLVSYIVASIAYGLQYIISEPQMAITNTPTEINTDNSPQSNMVDNKKMDYGNISIPYDPKRDLENYRYPTLDLLDYRECDGKPFVDMIVQRTNVNRIVDLLRNFGVEISSIKTTMGPRFTLYEICLAPGINYRKLNGLEDDLALALCSSRVRIAPIPNKGTIGIEVPNKELSIVSMRSIFGSRSFQETTMELPCAIGKTMTNEVFMFDLEIAHHVLIAGSTGQGKSVALNTIITSLLYKKHPAELKFVLIDPQITELGLYRPIAKHFLSCISDADYIVTKAIDALNTLESLYYEAKNRYRLFAIAGVRNIRDYNKLFVDRQLNPEVGHRYMPYIVVVIDSYSALALGYENQFIQALSKLLENGSAAGIHLIIATKRPSNDIISSQMKSYIPTRISFSLPERIDSQIILDCNGAEELIGSGDMFFKSKKDMFRIQCAYADTSEVERIIQHISGQQGYAMAFELPEPETNDEEVGESRDVDMQHLDPVFEDAARLIVREQCGSTSLIQRKFAFGYNRAGRLMDQLEKAGIVGVAHGSKPREVLIKDLRSLENLLMRWR